MKTCTVCWASNDDNTDTCAHCGRFLWGADETATARPAPAAGPPPPGAASGGGAPRARPAPPAPAPDADPGVAPPPSSDRRAGAPRPAPPAAAPGPAVTRTAGGRIRVQPGSAPRGLRPIQVGYPGGAPSPPAPLGPAGGAGGRPDQGFPAPPDSRLCPCGRQHPPSARFCPCGRTLVRIETAEPPRRTEAPPEQGWRGAGERRRFDRELRAAAGGGARGYDRALAATTVAVRALSTAAVVVVVLAALSGTARGWVTGRVGSLLPHNYREVVPTGAQAAGESPTGYSPLFAVDGFVNRAWATGWHQDRDVDTTCAGTAAHATALDLVFDTPTRVDQVMVRAGLPADVPDHGNQFRPRQVVLRFDEKTCVVENLQDVPDPQTFRASARGVTSVRIWVTGAYPPPSGQGTLVALSEIDFLAAR